jgi:lauroyl/myristoyl acyltransferase
MADSLQRFRRAATQLAIRQTIRATAAMPIDRKRSVVRSLVCLAGGLPMLRRRVRENMVLALGDPPPGAEREYFHHVGWALSNALATFHHGLAATPVSAEVRFDESLRLLDDAVAEGRGVVLATPHYSGYDLAGGVLARRHPMVVVARQAPTPERTERKLKWYRALGVDIVLRPDRRSAINDAAAYLNVLRRGKILAIAPDLLTDTETGAEACIFGRTARFHGGAFALARTARAPVIRPSFRWVSGSALVISFDRARPFPDACNRDVFIRDAVQDWCEWFERRMREDPAGWLFWLDKRWSRFLRKTPRGVGAK